MSKIRSLFKALLSLACITLLTWTFIQVRQCRQTGTPSPLFSFGLKQEHSPVLTPLQIRSIERIGQWEFFSIENEEIVDTVRHRLLLPDQHLARIYRGTLRLGIDLGRAEPDWVRMQADTVKVTLPPIILLNPQFIDEARTRTFHESGSWDAQSRELLYQKAKQTMLTRCLSEENIQKARAAGQEQLTALFHNLGFSNVVVE